MSDTGLIHLKTLQDTESLARRVAQSCRGAMLITLNGELGAGKTTFVRALAEALGASVIEVSSPTYVLAHEYKTSTGLHIEHWDVYRVPALPEELHEAVPSTHIRVVEWAERFPELQTQSDIDLSFSLLESGERSVRLRKGGS